MKYERARQYAACAAELSHEEPGAEGRFDMALTNGLAAIVAHEWPGKESNAKGRMLPASELLKIIEGQVPESPEPSVHVIEEAEDPEMERHWQRVGLLEDGESLPLLETRIDVAVLREGLDVTQPARHARGVGGLERRHIDALLALDDHPSLRSLSSEHADRAWENAQVEHRHAAARALAYLERIGEEEADLRASRAENPNAYHPKHNPEGGDLEECEVCGRVAFCVDGFDDRGYGFSYGQCLVCTYSRSSAVADDVAFGHYLGHQMSKGD
jgi:hypothetical protein